MAISQGLTNGMGGIRTAGDLVARMQFAKNMKIDEAKKYVADKLGVDTFQLTEENFIRDVRDELGLGIITGLPGSAMGMTAKMNIEDVLGIKIKNCEHFRDQLRRKNQL